METQRKYSKWFPDLISKYKNSNRTIKTVWGYIHYTNTEVIQCITNRNNDYKSFIAKYSDKIKHNKRRITDKSKIDLIETISFLSEYFDHPKPKVIVKDSLNCRCYAEPKLNELHFSNSMLTDSLSQFSKNEYGRLGLIVHEFAHLIASYFINDYYESCHNKLFREIENLILSIWGLKGVNYKKAYYSQIVRLCNNQRVWIHYARDY